MQLRPRNCTRNCAVTLQNAVRDKNAPVLTLRIPTKSINYTRLISYLTALPDGSDTLGLSPRSNINKYNTLAQWKLPIGSDTDEAGEAFHRRDQLSRRPPT